MLRVWSQVQAPDIHISHRTEYVTNRIRTGSGQKNIRSSRHEWDSISIKRSHRRGSECNCLNSRCMCTLQTRRKWTGTPLNQKHSMRGLRLLTGYKSSSPHTRPITCEETHAHGERRKRREKPPTHGSISSRSSLSLQPSSHTPDSLGTNSSTTPRRHTASDRGQPCFERGVPYLWTTRFDS
jgi:hypothetical protein